MSVLDIEKLKNNKTEIIKAEISTLLFNLGKTHAGFKYWKPAKFDIDDNDFLSCYGYESFCCYQEYFKKGAFEKDLERVSKELKKFFYETEMRFKDTSGQFKKHKPQKLIDILTHKGNFAKKIMFKGCENINSGIDKGSPQEQLHKLYISNAFGTYKSSVHDQNLFDKSRIAFYEELWEQLQTFDKEVTTLGTNEWICLRKFMLKKLRGWYSHLLSDSRFPANDVTLWDQVYMTASMFKAALAGICLDNSLYDYYLNTIDESKKPLIRWSILGVQYDKLALAEKALNPAFIDWYRERTFNVDEKIKKIIEEEYTLGNEIYRDETGIYFLAPENVIGNRVGSLYTLHESLEEIKEKIIECFKLLNGEAFPAILMSVPSRSTMNLAYLLENAQDNFLKASYPENIQEYIGGGNSKGRYFKVLCDVCRLRLADKENSEDLNLCDICRERKKEQERTKLHESAQETIWTPELQDKNGRIALITMKFELREWLNGNMLNTLLNRNKQLDVFGCLKNDLKEGVQVCASVIREMVETGEYGKSTRDFAYNLLCESSIGDRWEELIQKKLEDKVSFDDRKIHWDKLGDNDIEFLCQLLFQFLIRKNPSPARLYRVWETTQNFFESLNEYMHNIDNTKHNAKQINAKRIMWEGAIKESSLKNREFEYQGLEFLSDNDGNLYLISSFEKAAPILTRTSDITKIKLEQRSELDWKKDHIVLQAVGVTKKYTLDLTGSKKYIDYKPYLSIIKPTPISWQFIIRAEYVPGLIEKVKDEYNQEFKYVKGKLPLHIGIVTQYYKKPLYIGIKALRKIRRDIDSWKGIEKIVTGSELKQMHGCSSQNETKEAKDDNPRKFYSLYPLQEGEGEGGCEFYIDPAREAISIKDVEEMEESDQLKVYPNTIDFEFLDVNTRRNDICYDSKSCKRKILYKKNRPYTWEEWELFERFKRCFADDERKAQLHRIITLIYSKLDDWNDAESIKNFMLSAFVNTFDLKNSAKEQEKDDFARLFGRDSWKRLEGMCAEDFRDGLYRFLDMYDFWHNALGEI